MTSGDWVTIISASGISLVLVVNAIANGWGRKELKAQGQTILDKADVADQKLDQIHHLADGNLTRVSQQLETALARIDKLETILTKKIE